MTSTKDSKNTGSNDEKKIIQTKEKDMESVKPKTVNKSPNESGAKGRTRNKKVKPVKKSTSVKSNNLIFQNLTGGNGHHEQVLSVGSYRIHAGGIKEFIPSVGNALLRSPQIKAMIASNFLQVVEAK